MTISPLAYNKFRWIFCILLLLWTALQTYVLYSLGLNIEVALSDATVSNTLIGAFCWLISNNLSYYQPEKNKYVYILIWCLTLAAIWLAIIKYLLPTIVSSDTFYLQLLKSSLTIRFCFAFLLIGWMAMIAALWYTIQDQQETEKRKTEAERLNKEAELASLREKLQPHFLFNSLNSISALTLNKPQEARDMVQQLSDFLRGTLKNDDQSITLEAELQHLELYLSIEKVRFGHRLITKIDATVNLNQKVLPQMLLQPLLENAIKFGLYDTLDTVIINLNVAFEDGFLIITIANPFDKTTSHPNKGIGFGLNSVKRRLYLIYNRSDLLLTKTIDNQFITMIKIPQ